MRSSRRERRVSNLHLLPLHPIRKAHSVSLDEERQESREKRRRVDEHRRQDDAKAAREGVTHVLNGQEYVAVTPTNTARGGTLHPSLPSRPGFDLVPKDEVAKPPAGKQKKMTAAQREAEALKVGPEAIMAMQGSNKDVVENRKAIRMANLSAAQMLKAELEGDGEATGDVSINEDAQEDGTQPTTVENAEEEEKEQMGNDEAEAALDAQGEDEGVDADVVQSAVQDGVDGEAEVSKHGDEEMPEDDEDAEGEEDTAPRGTKRKAEEAEDELENEIANDDGIEDPPDIEADQPVSKKKLKVNPDGTIDGYVDDVK
jgi:5'-3' exoribonuclease 2